MTPRDADRAAVASPTASGPATDPPTDSGTDSTTDSLTGSDTDLARQPPGTAAQYPTLEDVPKQVALVNGSFEEPQISGQNEMLPDASQEDGTPVPGWRTTASDHVIEFWHSRSGVPAAHGVQFAELNANESSALYQDLETTPGSTLYWSLHHRGRSGDDTMSVKIGPPGRKPTKTWSFTDGKTAWKQHTGEYKVPRGQKATRFAFEAGATATGDPTVGNFLDNIVFGTAPCVVVTKTAEPEADVAVGDTVTYTVNLKNHGGVPAENLILRDVVPAGTAYVPGSMRVINGPGPSSAGTGWYDAKTRELTLPLGQGATAAQGGTLPSTLELPDGITTEFQVQVEHDGAGRTLTGRATATYENTRAGKTDRQLTSASSTATVTTAHPVGLVLTKAADRVHATVGEVLNYHLGVTNPGPGPADGVAVTDLLPAGLEFLSANGTGSYEPATGRWDVGALEAGGTADLELRVKIGAPGTYSNTAVLTDGPRGTTPGSDDADSRAAGTASVRVCAHPQPACTTTSDAGPGANAAPDPDADVDAGGTHPALGGATGGAAEWPEGAAFPVMVVPAGQGRPGPAVDVPCRPAYVTVAWGSGTCWPGCPGRTPQDRWTQPWTRPWAQPASPVPVIFGHHGFLRYGKKSRKARHQKQRIRELAWQIRLLSQEIDRLHRRS